MTRPLPGIGIDAYVAERYWQQWANCRGVDPDLFFPEDGAGVNIAKAVCAQCVVRPECLECALQDHELGVWGGTSEQERRRIRRTRRISAA